MRVTGCWVVGWLLLVCCAAVACGGSDEGGGGCPGACQSGANAARALGCTYDVQECNAECPDAQRDASSLGCAAEFDAMLACMSRSGNAAWECDDPGSDLSLDGSPQSPCYDEVYAAFRCTEDPGPASGGADCESVCTSGENLSSSIGCPLDTPQCELDCETLRSLAAASSCSAQSDSFLACVATADASAWACYDGEAEPAGDAGTPCYPHIEALATCISGQGAYDE